MRVGEQVVHGAPEDLRLQRADEGGVPEHFQDHEAVHVAPGADEEGGGLRGKRADRFWRQLLEAGTQRAAQRWNLCAGQLLVGEVTEQLMEEDGRDPAGTGGRAAVGRRLVMQQRRPVDELEPWGVLDCLPPEAFRGGDERRQVGAVTSSSRLEK